MEWFICYWAFAALVAAGVWTKTDESLPVLLARCAFSPLWFPLKLGATIEGLWRVGNKEAHDAD